MNLLSNDVYRFDAMSMFLNAMWTAPLLVITVGYLLWLEVQWAGMFGLIIVFIIVPIQSNYRFSFLFYLCLFFFSKQFSLFFFIRLYGQTVCEVSKSNSCSNG